MVNNNKKKFAALILLFVLLVSNYIPPYGARILRNLRNCQKAPPYGRRASIFLSRGGMLTTAGMIGKGR